MNSPIDAATSRPRPLFWLSGAVIAVSLAALLAAHLPDRAKLLGLFPLVWGLAAGAGLRWWAHECHLAAPRWMLLCALLLLLGGEAGIVLETWRGHRSDLQRQFAKDPSAGFVKQAQQAAATSALEKASPEETALRQQLQAEVERVREVRRQTRSLSAFLRRRLKALGDWSQPWPELFWGGEIVLGSLAGMWILSRPAPPIAAIEIESIDPA